MQRCWDGTLNLKELKGNARASYKLWRYAGKPHCGELFDAKDIEEGHNSRFWSRFHGGLHHSKSKSLTRIAEALSAEDILKVWKDYFSAIVNNESCESVKE